MLFSLILPTYERTSTLTCLLDSLVRQSCSDFELIVIDQNADDRVTKILTQYTELLNILHAQRPPGLSSAKNAGLHLASGLYVMFPDDDCWLPDTLLDDVLRLLEEKKSDFVCFTARDSNGLEIIPFAKGQGWATRHSIWRQCCAISFMSKTSILRKCGGFHTDFGLGSKWPSGEDMELPIRMLNLGYCGYYSSQLFIYHPASSALPPQEQVKRVKKYAPATGRIWQIHKYQFTYILYHLLRPLAGSFWAIIQGKYVTCHCHWFAFIGRLHGWISAGEKNVWPLPIVPGKFEDSGANHVTPPAASHAKTKF